MRHLHEIYKDINDVPLWDSVNVEKMISGGNKLPKGKIKEWTKWQFGLLALSLSGFSLMLGAVIQMGMKVINIVWGN